jgi:allantoicase
VEANPEVNLPSVLNIEATFEEFPPLVSIQKTHLKDTEIDNRESWAEVVSKDNSLNKHLNVQNDRFILEC